MARSRLALCILAVAPAISDASSAFLQQASRSHVHVRAFAGLRFSPQDPAARTLLTLDTDHDGRIDPDEVAAFARSQGLDAEAATQEFSSIDANGDGVLDSAELQQLLGASPPPKFAAGRQTEGVTAAPPMAAAVIVDSAAETQDADSHAMLAEEVPLPAVAAPKSALISETSRTSVRVAAEKVAEDLALEEKEETKARELDSKAAEVRASFTALAKSTAQSALKAGAKAAHANVDELMVKISKLEDEAQKAEVRAAALTSRSKLEMEQGKELMAVADQALKEAARSRI